MPSENNQTKLIPLTEWSKYHPWPPIGGLRHLVFHENKNGFHQCVVRIGRRVLIDENAFFNWASGNKEQIKRE